MGGSDYRFTGQKRAPARAAVPTVVPLLVGAKEAARSLGISERTLWSLTKRAKVPHVRLGRRVLYDPDDLRAWVQGLKDSPESPSQG